MKTTSAPRPTKTRAEKLELHRLREATLLLVGPECAVGIEYQTGGTPQATLVGRGKAHAEMVWYAHEQAIPVVELPGLTPEEWLLFRKAEDIPVEAYKAVANALALVYRTRNNQELVRFIRPLSQAPRHLAEQAASLVEEFGSILDLPMLYVQCGNLVWQQRLPLEEAVSALRARVALETGQPLPAIPLRLNPHLPDQHYRLIFKDSAAEEGDLELPSDSPERIFPLLARIRQVLNQHGWEMLSYDHVEALLARNRREHPSLYRQLFPEHITVLAVRRILHNLLREGLAIREMTLILEVILEHLPFTQDADLLTELVRARFARELSQKISDPNGHLPVVVLDVEVEDTMLSAVREDGEVRWLDATPDLALRFLRAVGDALKEAAALNVRCALLVTPTLRRFLAVLLHTVYADVPVLAYNEVAPLTEVRAVAHVHFPKAALTP
ncbi:MAG TPA: FHIPEP family type III secretion protein [Candidatus Xenobia bacterium]|jgi:flagellar biosynthesis component FlhA